MAELITRISTPHLEPTHQAGVCTYISTCSDSGLKTNASQSNGLHVGEVGDIAKDFGGVGILQSILHRLLALPHQLGRDQVFGWRAIDGLGVFNDVPAGQSVLLPGALNEGHVGLHVVVAVEVDIGLVRIHNSSVVRHGDGSNESLGVCKEILEEGEIVETGSCLVRSTAY